MKGAPERILERCTTIYIDGTDIELNDCKRNKNHDCETHFVV
jgi:magnesium-transporting ATPase (P-type)